MDASATLARRLANYRATLARTPASALDGSVEVDRRRSPRAAEAHAERIAGALGGELVRGAGGPVVRLEAPARPIAVDRARLATLPGLPPPDVPLVCLDTETTGLATAAGTLAFLVGLGWWQGDRFRQVQLLLPDHAAESALLVELDRHLPPSGWLVTYNGRGFDWPLLVTRYRMHHRPAPMLDGHLDLLPLVRRLFRHRMPDARLRSVERSLLDVHRPADIEGWEIPARYFDVLGGGPAEALVEIVRHNDEDVRSLARLLAHLERRLGDPASLRRADPGDLAGIARAYRQERRLDEALRCLDLALEAPPPPVRSTAPAARPPRVVAADEWWAPGGRADFGGPPRPRYDSAIDGTAGPQRQAFATPWTEERLLLERAHLLRRLGRPLDAADALAALTAGTSRIAAVAATELAKLREHRLRDVPGALAAVERGWAILDRRRRLGRPEPRLEADLRRRALRLRRRLARRARREGRRTGQRVA